MEIAVDIKEAYPEHPRVSIQCREESAEVRDIIHLLETRDKKLIATLGNENYVINPRQVLYAESVDGVTYVYTKEEVYRTSYTLTELEENYSPRGYFRCSKSAVLNLHAIKILKSEMGNRIDACLLNGEHIMISRKYAKQLRAILKGGDRE